MPSDLTLVHAMAACQERVDAARRLVNGYCNRRITRQDFDHMNYRRVSVATIALAASLTVSPCPPLPSAEQSVTKKLEHPAASLANEPLLPDVSLEKATEFLDAGARAHEKKCVNCHASFAYLMARPALPVFTEKHGEVRKSLEDWVAYLEGLQLRTTSDSRRRAEAVMSGAVLAQHDAETTGKLRPVTRRALDLMWQVQLPDGGFDWLKPNDEPPSAIDNHFGATMAAIAAGIAPGGYADSPKTRVHIDKLRGYLRTHPPQHMHQRGMLMLADHFLGGLMSEQKRRHIVSDLFELQHPDGGWALAALGDATWKRKDNTPQDLTTSDGYGTGFSVYVLRTAGGIPADDGRIQRAVAWLKSNQRASGGWYSRSPKNKDALSSYVGSAYAVMALKACEDESP